MSGNSARRRMLKFMPADFRLIETRQPPLKDQYDEWLARVICYAFSVPATPFVSQVNRATCETMRLQATQEGLVPLKTWIKSALDQVIQVCMGEPGPRIRLGRRRRDRPAAAGPDAANSGLGRDQDARGGAGGAGAGGRGEGGPASRGSGSTITITTSKGRFATAEGADTPDDTVKPTLVAERAPSETPAGYKLPPKIQRGMEKRGWTVEQIDKAVKLGNRIDAKNKENGGRATRYVNPDTGKSVVIDNTTNEVIHVGEERFRIRPRKRRRARRGHAATTVR